MSERHAVPLLRGGRRESVAPEQAGLGVELGYDRSRIDRGRQRRVGDGAVVADVRHKRR